MNLTNTAGDNPNGHGKYAALNNETRDALFPLPIPPPQAVEGGKVSLREFHIKTTHPAPRALHRWLPAWNSFYA